MEKPTLKCPAWQFKAALHGAGRAVLNLAVPARCALCRQRSEGGFCHGCRELLPWMINRCEYCGGEPQASGPCKGCLQQPPAWEAMRAPLRYAPPVSRLLHGLKYQDRVQYAAPLAMLLAEHVLRGNSPLPEALLPIPLHPARLRTRGFNQAQLIAVSAGRLLGIPVDDTLIRRQRKTRSQTDLDERSRRKNMKNAFAVRAPGRYDAVALVDDVITSGATMGAACDALHDQGYKRVSVWAAAKT